MIFKKFRDIEISALGMGSLRLPAKPDNPNSIDREAAKKVIDAAFESGINYFDTAYTYHKGDSEIFLGEALKKYPRDSYYLASKFYVAAGIGIEDSFEEQLKRCKTEYFDFYLFHGLEEEYFDAYTSKEKDYLGYLLKQKEAGRIRYLGFSSHAEPDTLEQFLNWYDGFDMALIQLNYLDWFLLDGKRQYEILTDRGIPIWVMEPLKGGRLSTLNEKAVSVLKTAAPKKSISSWAFRYLMSLPNVQTVLSGMSSADQVYDNANTFEFLDPLNEDEKAALQKAIDVFMEELGVPCSGCRYCCDTCPAKLNIPLLIKAYNEMRVSGSTWKIQNLSNEKGPENCLKCGICKKHCPQKIDIPKVLSIFADMCRK